MSAKSKPKSAADSLAASLAQNLCEALLRERCIPHFVDTYVIEHGRHSIQVHAGLYRDLLSLLQREALLATSARVLELIRHGASDPQAPKHKPMTRKEAAAFRQKFLNALTRHQRWNLGEALDFQSDLQMYEELIARAGVPRRPRKSYEPANHPFVDRCAFVLDSSFLEKARVAASRALSDLESLTSKVVNSTGPARIDA